MHLRPPSSSHIHMKITRTYGACSHNAAFSEGDLPLGTSTTNYPFWAHPSSRFTYAPRVAALAFNSTGCIASSFGIACRLHFSLQPLLLHCS
ncbi:MAG: hypothetical protein CVV52_16575 [Spirochaetae bacterium HGW-Spirochaetae-8]|nr:MAG: hypothetical protein CVV52_16575 [Spirochaetae bacterium HGW-Spirochaetae-8]